MVWFSKDVKENVDGKDDKDETSFLIMKKQSTQITTATTSSSDGFLISNNNTNNNGTSENNDETTTKEQYCLPTNEEGEKNGDDSSKIIVGRRKERSLIGSSSSHDSTRSRSNHVIMPLSMRFMRSFSGLCCQECTNRNLKESNTANTNNDNNNIQEQDSLVTAEENNDDDEKEENMVLLNLLKHKNSVVSPLVLQPMMSSTGSSTNNNTDIIEQIIGEYISSCKFYGLGNRINSGVLTTLRFSLPSLRVSGQFHDADMLALSEILFKYCNTHLKFIKRLDFSIASKEGKLHKIPGFRSHGALTLSKIIQCSKYIEEIYLPRNRIGPYGASAIFIAASQSPNLKVLIMRRCHIGERGALAFAEYVINSSITGLQEVDLSANRIGFHGTTIIENQLLLRTTNSMNANNNNNNKTTSSISSKTNYTYLSVDLEGNLVLQEVMNGVTHGLGILLAIIGTVILQRRIKEKNSLKHTISCTIYSTSLLVLYTSSTLYHSFFTLQATKYIFEVMDKCAIYILIAGSYTPFCQIVMADNIFWSTYMLCVIWFCAVCGIIVEASAPVWKHKLLFSLIMYVSMGWTAAICLPDIIQRVPINAVHFLVLGGVSYTVGIPFFVRNNNLDHSIWHLFVLAALEEVRTRS